ncbi:hypothetical protein PanWU01x14_326860, partial [Parasponia andersonii]
MVIPRARSSGAASISSYFLGALFPMEAKAMVRAAVRVVLPWSTWPIVPMLTCGFLRSNFPLAARTKNDLRLRMEFPAGGESEMEKRNGFEALVEEKRGEGFAASEVSVGFERERWRERVGDDDDDRDGIEGTLNGAPIMDAIAKTQSL